MVEIKLCNYNESHLNKTIEWLNNSLIKKNFGVTNKITLENHKNWIQTTNNVILKTIYKEDRYIGNILLHLNKKHNSGFFQIYIGENIESGKGYAQRALKMSLEEFFSIEGLNRIWLKVFTDNLPAIHIYEKIGFRLEGIERESFLYEGKYKDQMIFSILKKEWDNKC